MDSARTVNGENSRQPLFRLGEVYTREDFIEMLDCSPRTWKKYRDAGLRPLDGCKTHLFLSDHVVHIATTIKSDDEQEE